MPGALLSAAALLGHCSPEPGSERARLVSLGWVEAVGGIMHAPPPAQPQLGSAAGPTLPSGLTLPRWPSTGLVSRAVPGKIQDAPSPP